MQKELPHSRSGALTEARARSFPVPLFQKGRFLAVVVLEPLWVESGIFENQCAAISERDFYGSPIRALVVSLGLWAGGISFLIEPVQVRFVIRDPFLDGLPGRLDGLHGFDVEGRRWWAGKMNGAFPQAVEAEEGADGFHGALAAGALRISGGNWVVCGRDRIIISSRKEAQKPQNDKDEAFCGSVWLFVAKKVLE